MPFLKLQTTEELLHADQLISKTSSFLSGLLGKPEKFIMISLDEKHQMLFGGSDEPIFYCELKSIGLPKEKTKDISRQLMAFLSDETGVAIDRIYIEFTNVEGSMWGWNGSTFEK
jgi:phenylpyruvate tautomerase